MTFSILIPAYKRRFLAEAVESVLAQTCADFELIIVNDASPEDLRSVVTPYLGDPRVRYYENAHNCGAVDVVDNWNICLSHAAGDYVLCMGDDDRLLPHCLTCYAHLIKQFPGLALYHGWTELIDESGAVVHMQEPRPLKEDVYSMMWGRWHGRTQYIGDFLFLAAPLKQAGGFYKIPLAWGSDDISAFRAAAIGGVANTQEPVFQYRVSGRTISRTGNAIMKLRSVDDYEQWCRQFLACEPPAALTPSARVFRRDCLDTFARTMAKKRVLEMAAAIRHAPLRWTAHFFLHRKQYHVRCSHIIYAAITALKNARVSNS